MGPSETSKTSRAMQWGVDEELVQPQTAAAAQPHMQRHLLACIAHQTAPYPYMHGRQYRAHTCLRRPSGDGLLHPSDTGAARGRRLYVTPACQDAGMHLCIDADSRPANTQPGTSPARNTNLMPPAPARAPMSPGHHVRRERALWAENAS